MDQETVRKLQTTSIIIGIITGSLTIYQILRDLKRQKKIEEGEPMGSTEFKLY